MMFRSPKFWWPFIISLVINAPWLVVALGGMGFASRSTEDEIALGRFLFPYFSAFSDVFPDISFISIFLQVPVYGFVIGWGWANNKLKISLLAIIAAHSVAYGIALFT